MGLLATVQAAVDTAFAAIDDLVADVWLTRQVSGAYNSATGVTAQTEIEYRFEGVVDTRRESGGFNTDASGNTGSEVEGENVRVYLKPGEVAPKVGDVLRINEKRLRVTEVLPVQPDGKTVLLWELRVTL